MQILVYGFSNFPTEDDQYGSLQTVLEGMNLIEAVVRTMDIGGDKELPYFDLPKEMNPVLGLPCFTYLNL